MLRPLRPYNPNIYGRAILCLIIALTLLWSVGSPVLPGFAYAHAPIISITDPILATRLVALENNVLPILSRSSVTVLSVAQPNQNLDIGLTLGLHNTELLNEWLHQLYSPNSGNYGKFLSSAQFNRLFAPTQVDQDAVNNYLQSQGLSVYKTFDNHALIRARGTVLQVQNAFGVAINNYRASDGRIFYANSQPPKLPAAIANKILNVQGLENFVQPQHRSPLKPPTSFLGWLNPQSVGPKAAPGGGPNGGLTPSQWQSFYNLGPIYAANLKGQGQVLAITAFDTFKRSDLDTFLQQYNLPRVPTEIRGAGLTAYPQPGSYGEFEVISDLEMAAATAPAMTKLVVYEDIDLVTMFQEFVNDRLASVLSNSYGFPCDTAQPTSYLAAQTQVLQQAAAQGQTVVVASGDDLAYSCRNSSVPSASQNDNPAIGAPDDNPWVLTVGGSSINFSANPTSPTLSYTGESAWNCPSSDFVSNCQAANQGSTGGVSSGFFAQPWWQRGVTDATLSATGRTGRATPDLAFYADIRAPQDTVIEPGYSIYCSDQTFCADVPGWLQGGGNSLAAPAVAAIILLANQAKGVPLGFVNPTLYASARNGAIFHDITTGNNGAYNAGVGWDATTGLGSFDANALITALKTATPPSTPAGSGLVFNYYVPFVAGNPKNLPSAYDTALYIQNEGATATNSTKVTYYNQFGAILGTESPPNGTIAAHGQFLINQGFTGPLSTGNGGTAAALVQSDQPLNIMVTESTPVGASAYNAIANVADVVDQDSSLPGLPTTLPAATSNVLLPAIFNSGGFFRTNINIFNAGNVATNVNVAYFDNAGSPIVSETRRIAANGSVSIDNSASGTVLPAGFGGSAIVSSPDGVPLAVQVVENRPEINFVASYPGVGIPSQQVFAPAIYNQTFGRFYTGMNVVNTSGDAVITATVTFFKEDGSVVGSQTTDPIPPHGTVPLFQGNTDPTKGVVLPMGLSMSALVQATGPVALIVNEYGGGSVAGSYSGLLAGASVLNLPTIQANFYGGTSGFVVQNLSATPVTATLQYYDPNGQAVGNSLPLTIQAHGIVNQYNRPGDSGLPNNFVGNAVITAAPGSQLIVTCNVSNAGAPGVTNPYFYSYTSP